MARKSWVSSCFHCVFSTKERPNLITPAFQEKLWPFLDGIARQTKMKVLVGLRRSDVPSGLVFVSRTATRR
jgi:hypothetical protein